MRQWIIILVAFLMAPAGMQVQAQGCSDAGFCTAGALQHSGATDSLTQSSIGLSMTVGSGEQGVLTFIPQVEWKEQISPSWNLEAKVSYYIANGNLGTYAGVGDPIITVTKLWMNRRDWRAFGTVGVRASLTDAAESDSKGRPLPMPYQYGLGTTDIIAGLSAQYRQWLFLSVGYQQPIVHYNKNGYLSDVLPKEDADYKSYFDSRRLERRGDVLFRAEGMYARNRWSYSGGPLLIYHLGNDGVSDLFGREMSVEGSEGLTFNLAAKVAYARGRSRWELGGGAPIVFRKARPDGLTRHWLFTLRYERLLK
jgi:hypothetical protein